MFFEFDHKGNGIFYNVIFREEGIMNIIHYDQGVSNETDRCRKNYIREKNMVSSFGMVRNVVIMKNKLLNHRFVAKRQITSKITIF